MGVPTPQLGVFAAPVQSFEQTSAGQGTRQIAEALSQLSPQLARLGQQAQLARAEQQTEAGRRAATISQAADFRDAVKRGEIRPAQSPFFRRAFDQQRAVVAGGRLEIEARAAYQQWEGRDTDNDGSGFQQFFSDFVRERLQGITNPDYLAGLEPRLRAIQQNLTATHSAYTADRLEKETADNTALEVADIINGLGSNLSPDEFFARLEPRRQAFRATGVSPRTLDNAVIQAIEAKAVQSLDTEYLDLLDAKRPDGTPPISAIPTNRLRIEQIRKEVNYLSYLKQQADARGESDGRKDARTVAGQEAYAAAAANSGQVPRETEIQLVRQLGVETARTIVSATEALFRDDGLGDFSEEDLDAANRAAFVDGDVASILEMIRLNQIPKESRAEYLKGAVAAARSQRGESRAIASAERAAAAYNSGIGGLLNGTPTTNPNEPTPEQVQELLRRRGDPGFISEFNRQHARYGFPAARYLK